MQLWRKESLNSCRRDSYTSRVVQCHQTEVVAAVGLHPVPPPFDV
jgi:hypothetical protein